MTETAAKRMKIVDVPQPGGPEALVLAERPVPEPGRGEVLIKVAAAGLNRADTLQRRGFYPSPAGAPSYPGLEVSGTIDALGDGVSEFKVGDAVCALLAGGGYAEFVLTHDGIFMYNRNGVKEKSSKYTSPARSSASISSVSADSPTSGPIAMSPPSTRNSSAVSPSA